MLVSTLSTQQMKSFIPLSSRTQPNVLPSFCSATDERNQMWRNIVLINLRSKLHQKDRLRDKLKPAHLHWRSLLILFFLSPCFQVEGNPGQLVCFKCSKACNKARQKLFLLHRGREKKQHSTSASFCPLCRHLFYISNDSFLCEV